MHIARGVCVCVRVFSFFFFLSFIHPHPFSPFLLYKHGGVFFFLLLPNDFTITYTSCRGLFRHPLPLRLSLSLLGHLARVCVFVCVKRFSLECPYSTDTQGGEN